MAQVGWVYLDDFGNRHRVGVYHGDRTGHLLIHCDGKIVQIDFSVKDSRTYSLFIEDELCEIGIYKEKEGFTYDFQVNKKIDTPRNRLRRVEERRTRKQIALFLVGFVALVAVAVIGFQWFGRSQREKFAGPMRLDSRLTAEYEQRWAAEGKAAIAQLYIVEEAAHRRVFYNFLTDKNRQVSGLFYVPDTGLIILPNGFPLADKDAFRIEYLPGNPQIHRVDFFQPADQTLAGYLERALDAEQRAHPQATAGYSLCLARLTLEQKGWEHLADLIFQSTSPEKNLKNNRDSYLRLVREPEFAKAVERECWDK